MNEDLKKEFEKLIISNLFKAWEAGKKQKLTPHEYTLDTDKLGRPIFDFVETAITKAREDGFEEGRKDMLIAVKTLGTENEGLFLIKKKAINALGRTLTQDKEK